MISGNINTLSLILVAVLIGALIIGFLVMFLTKNNNTQTLEQSVRTALIQNRDDAARVNSHTLYALNVNEFEKQVRKTPLQEMKAHHGDQAQFKFYYLLQNGNLYDTKTFQNKVEKNTLKKGRNETTLIKGVTVDVTFPEKDLKTGKYDFSHRGVPTKHLATEHEMKASDGMKRFSVTYVIDGGLVTNPGNDKAEAHRLYPAAYERPNTLHQGEQLKPNSMLNVTDN